MRESAYGRRKPTYSFRCCPFCKQVIELRAKHCEHCGKSSEFNKPPEKIREYTWMKGGA